MAQWNMYNYLEAMGEDIRTYIEENVTPGEYYSRDNMESELNDKLFFEDSITGNGSGSYTFSRAQAREYVMGDPEAAEYIRQLVEEFGVERAVVANKFLDEDWEYWDVSIRCYLLGQAIAQALDDMDDVGVLDEYI